MKKTLCSLIIAILCSCCAFADTVSHDNSTSNIVCKKNIKRSSVTVTEAREINGFHSIKVSDGIMAIVSQSDTWSVEVSADKNLIAQIVPPVKERMKVLSDVVPLTSFLFRDVPVEDKATYIAKGSDEENTKEALIEGSEILLNGLKNGKAESEIEEDLVVLSQKLGIKVNGVFQPIRVAITNSTVSLPLFDSIRLLGIEETENRLKRAERLFEEK